MSSGKTLDREAKKMKLRLMSELLSAYTREGELYQKLEDNRVLCYSCGHRCRISDGLAGVCKVRFNRGGKLYIPWGYVAGLQCDPIEKKPFFHALPGTDALSFGMLGCDFHCNYCFTGDTVVITDRGPISFLEAFNSAERVDRLSDAEIAYPVGLKAVASSGLMRRVRAVFKHPFKGKLTVIRPFYLPPLRCTPDHRIFATDDVSVAPEPIKAAELTKKHYLAIPRCFEFSSEKFLNVLELLSEHQVTETEDYYLIPIRDIGCINYEGDVYNMEVEEEHNYLANFFVVKNCQNWVSSQVLRDADATAPARLIDADQIISIAERENASTITSTYNEPLITSEWAISVFRKAKDRGFLTSYVSNGNGTPEVLDYIRPWVDLYKVDLKSFRDRRYRELGGLLSNVLDTIRGLKERGFWLEIVTLVIPGFNDSIEELREMAEFLVSVDPFIPWHVTAFHADYKMQDKGNTSASTLLRAVEAGAAAGLKYVYAGNAPGRVDRWENTWCHSCGELLIERFAYRILKINLKGGKCPKCLVDIPGVWKSPRFDTDNSKIDNNHGYVRSLRF